MTPEDREKMMSSRMTKEEYEKAEEEKHRREHPEDFQKVQMYLEPSFKEYCKQKYGASEEAAKTGSVGKAFENPQILQMIYALEWHNLKRTNYSDLIEYHPYLTVGDQQRLSDLNIEHSLSSGVTLVLSSIIANR